MSDKNDEINMERRKIEERKILEQVKIVPALLLDIDGTVRESKSSKTFIEGLSDIKLIDGIEEVIWKYKNDGYLIIGISNQGGVAYGYKTVQQVNREFTAMCILFQNDPFDDIYMCPFMEGGSIHPFNHRSMMRKPSIGMLAIAEDNMYKKYNKVIDWDKSLLVGDRPEDEQCAANAGIQFYHIDQFLKMNKNETELKP
jgi:D-glycero-D-manno-heptose 1,7-bisphosphate phosphatase